MKYPGKELENFDKATIWRKYIYFHIQSFIRAKVLEVGAGIGSFTENYKHKIKDLTLSELDANNLKIIKKKFKSTNLSFTNKTVKNLNKNFDTIMYLNVLEHVKNDKNEIKIAFQKLKKNGHLIILVPAHNELYSKFDKAVGHFKRYDKNFFDNLNLKNSEIKKFIFLDSMGYLLYFLNKFFFKDEVYPSKFKILIWDKIFTPMTFFLDKLFLNKFGKNILYIVKKL
ncbi:methyltransferase domain-containing protein [Pelagibacteraceae bacterium]|jgi:ubiquinone/menaquinone biosynthesis C-methylase UbiE|nr:methyltransferase domain-containing protein [Pelagibacteraceae bacterium]